VKALVERAVSEFGALDIAFNNAGLLPPTARLAEQTEDDWAKIMRVDVTGVFLCSSTSRRRWPRLAGARS
jgi:NAD(P)-dependent dehydrogenase (short-subunit alcohol dehydrogenase family)